MVEGPSVNSLGHERCLWLGLAKDANRKGNCVGGKPVGVLAMGFVPIFPAPNTPSLMPPIATPLQIAGAKSGGIGTIVDGNGGSEGKGDGFDFHGSENDGAAIGSDLRHALAVEGAPCALPFVTSNAEVTATDDGRELAGLASAFDLLSVAGVETELAEGTVLLNEADGDDAGASFVDELADEGGFVHG